MEENIKRPKPDLTIGSDSVLFKEGEVVIYSSYDMEDWKVTSYRKAAIVFKDKTYFLVSKSMMEDGTFRYKLREWPEDHVDLPSQSIVYDEEYVAERNDYYIKAERLKKVSILMIVIQPLLGFLTSSQKRKLQKEYGIEPVAVTNYSLFLEYLCLVSLSSSYVIQIFTRIFPSWFNYAPVVILVLLVDTIIRYHHILGESVYPYGFYEWIFKLRLK